VRRRTEIVLFVVAFLVFGATASRSLLCMDVWSANYASWMLATSGSPFLDGASVPKLDESPLRWVWVQDAPNGHTVITRAPAVVIAGIPAHLVAQTDTVSLLPGAFTAAAITALAVLLMHLALSGVMSRRRALVSTAVFAFTTPVWSVAANGVWPQTITVLAISIVSWSAVGQRWWTMGMGGVLLLSARPHAALVVAILGLTLAWRARRVDVAVRVGVPGLVGLFLVAGWTRWVYGSWNPTKLYGAGSFAEVEKSVVDIPNQLGMWISPDRGILVFTPLLLVLLPAVVHAWGSLPLWTRTLLVAGLTYTLLQGAMIGFTGGDPIYGYRYGLEFLACATPAFALAASHARATELRLIGPVVGLQFVVILLGSIAEGVALNYTMAWSANAFARAMYHEPALIPIALAIGVPVAVAVDRLARSGRPRSEDVEPGSAGRAEGLVVTT
jgi:hypothetical protein